MAQIADTPTMYVAPGFHADPVWLEDQRDYMVSLLSSTEQNLLITKFDPGYGVYLSELSYLKPYFDLNPDKREYIKRLIAEGRIGTGGAYNQPSETLIGPEAFIKNILYGKAFHEGVLGDTADVFMCWDVFGHTPQLSQILSKSRFKGVVWSKDIYGFPPNFFHESLDGTRSLHKREMYGFRTSGLEDMLRLAEGRLKEQGLYGLSSEVRFDAMDFKAPTPFFMGASAELAKNNPRILVTGKGASRFFEDTLRQIESNNLSLPVTSRDMAYFHLGTGVSRVEFKQANRLAENALLNASRFATIANYLGAEYPEAALDKGWRQLLFGQHHDAITGSICDRSYLDLMSGYREAVELGAETYRNSIQYLADQVNTKKQSPKGATKALVVFNPMAWERSDECHFEFDPREAGFGEARIVDAQGKEVPCQSWSVPLDRGKPSSKKEQMVFIAEKVPSLGYKTYYVLPGNTVQSVETPGESIENDHFKLTVDPQRGGGIVSLIDKRTGKEFVKKGDAPANEIVALDENIGRRSAPWELWTTGGQAFSRDYPAKAKVVKGPIYEKIIVSGDMRGCERVQEIVLYKNLDRIEFLTYLVGYTGKAELFVVTFPFDLPGVEPVCEDRFGALTRRRSKGFLEFQSLFRDNYAGTGARNAYQWMDCGYSGKIKFGANDGTAALGMMGLVIPHNDALRQAATKLQSAFIRKTIPSTIWYDDGDRAAREFLGNDERSTDNTQQADMNDDLGYGTSFRIALGSPELNLYTKALFEKLDAKTRRKVDELLDKGDVGYLYLKDSALPEGWEALPVLVVLGTNSAKVAERVEKLAMDFASDGEISLPPESNISGETPALDSNGVALLNVGNVVNSIERDGTAMMALMHTSSWGGTKWGPDRLPFQLVPEWRTHVYPYAIYPHAGDWREAKVHRAGFEYNNPLVPVMSDLHGGFLPPQLSFVTVEPDNLILTMLKPLGNPMPNFQSAKPDAKKGMIARFYEATGQPAKGRVKFFAPLKEGWNCNILEDHVSQLKLASSQVELDVSPFSIETLDLVPTAPADSGQKRVLGRQAEPVQPLYVRFWDHNANVEPIGYEPVAITLAGDVKTGLKIRQGGVSINEVSVNIVNDYVDRSISGVAHVIVPEDWKALPSEIPYDIPAGGSQSTKVLIAFLSSDRDQRDRRLVKERSGLIKARLEHDGQTYEDVLEVRDSRLAVRLYTSQDPTKPKEITLTTTVDRLDDGVQVGLENPNTQEIEGQVELITPLECWSASDVKSFSLNTITPWRKGFKIPAQKSETFKFPFERSLTSQTPMWAIVKVSYNGRVEYTPVPGMLRQETLAELEGVPSGGF